MSIVRYELCSACVCVRLYCVHIVHGADSIQC